jgi:hypothetical protein
MSAKEKPYCQTAGKWICGRLHDRYALAPLTGQDARAFKAFFHLVELYGACDEPGQAHAIAALYHTVQAMQPSTRHLAKAGIPHVLDWCHEEEIWLALQEYATTAFAVAKAEGVS